MKTVFTRALLGIVACVCLIAPVSERRSAAKVAYGAGTALVVVRSASAVIAAVDSKETWREYRDGKWSVEERSICKAAPVGPFYAMVAGLDRGSGFDALRETAEVWRAGYTLDQLAARAGASLLRSVGNLLDRLREADPDEFERRYGRDTALQLALFGVENRTPEVIILQILKDRSLLTTRCPGTCPTPRSAFFLGTHDQIDETARRNRLLVSHLDAKNIASLIDLEREDRPDVVGGPVAVIRVTASRSEVIETGACK